MTISLPVECEGSTRFRVSLYSKQAVLVELAPSHKRTAKEVAFVTKPTGMGMI